MEIKEIFLHKYPSNRWFINGIHSFLSRADSTALTSLTVCDAYSYFVGQA